MEAKIGTRDITLAQARHEASTVFLAKVFNWMAIGLGLTGTIAFFTAQSGMVRALISSPIFFILVLAELGMVFYLSARIEKIQPGTATGLFVGYSVLNGMTIIRHLSRLYACVHCRYFFYNRRHVRRHGGLRHGHQA
jgi:uncharacterized protein